MSTDLTQFNFHGNGVRTLQDEHGEPWFVAADIARVLGYRDSHVLTRRIDEDDRDTRIVCTPGGDQSVTVISEPGLYVGVLGSSVPQAREFKRWVTKEVLPSIRKTGGYIAPVTGLDELEVAERYLQALRDKRALAERVAELTPAAEAWGSYISSAGDYSVNEAAKILSRDHAIHTGERRLRSTLEEMGWVYRQSGEPRASQAQIDLGRMAEKASFYYHPESGERVAKTPLVRITPKGIDSLRTKLARQLVTV